MYSFRSSFNSIPLLVISFTFTLSASTINKGKTKFEREELWARVSHFFFYQAISISLWGAHNDHLSKKHKATGKSSGFQQLCIAHHTCPISCPFLGHSVPNSNMYQKRQKQKQQQCEIHALFLNFSSKATYVVPLSAFTRER